MIIPSIYLIIAGQVALVLLCLVFYLVFMLVSEENRWESYTDKLKAKIRELLVYKDRFDIVSENMHKQMELTKELTEQVEELNQQAEEKDTKIIEHEATIAEIQSKLSDLEAIQNQIDEKNALIESSEQTISELRTQIALLEDQGSELPDQISGLNITIESLETENKTLKDDLGVANESIINFQQTAQSVSNGFNIELDGKSNRSSSDQSDLMDKIQSRYDEEVTRLKKNYGNQKNIIDDLERAIMDAKNNPGKALDIDETMLPKLQQMLSESNTVIEMLEAEITNMQAEMSQLQDQNKQLASSIAENKTAAETSPSAAIDDTKDNEFFSDGEAETSTESSDDVFFDDAASEDKAPAADDVFFDDAASEAPPPAADDVFFDDADTDDVFFSDTEQPTDNTANTEQSATDLDPEIEQLQAQLDTANKMAMTMMMSSGDQGNIINFSRNSIEYDSLESLSKGVLETVALFQVNACLQVRGTDSAALNLSTYGQLTAQDTLKISDLTSSDRFEEDGPELLIRFKLISLLIKDMPLNDMDKVGRIKDTLAIVLELACSKLLSIESAIKIEKNQKILNRVLKNTYETIQNVEKQFNQQNEVTNQVVNSLTGIISNPAMTAGMDPIYRDVFTSIISDGKKQFDTIKSKGLAIDENFAEIVRRLGSKLNE